MFGDLFEIIFNCGLVLEVNVLDYFLGIDLRRHQLLAQITSFDQIELFVVFESLELMLLEKVSDAIFQTDHALQQGFDIQLV
jgi:hypothetical protein